MHMTLFQSKRPSKSKERIHVRSSVFVSGDVCFPCSVAICYAKKACHKKSLRAAGQGRVPRALKIERIYFRQEACKVLTEKWEKPYLVVRGFINARMSIALVRATNRCIRIFRTPASNMSNRFRWEGGAGLGLLKSDN